jgi:hypothetical protein
MNPRNRFKSMIVVTLNTMKRNLLRRGIMLIATLAASTSVWAANHQICYQLPPSAYMTQSLTARFSCRTDGATQAGCTIASVTGASTPMVVSINRTGVSEDEEVTVTSIGAYVGEFRFTDGTVRKCTVEVKNDTLAPAGGMQARQLIGFTTDESGFVMTGVWQAVSAAADQAFQQVVVPPDFVAVGGGAEGTENPGTLVNVSINDGPRVWLAGVHANGAGTSAATGWGIGLKIEGVPAATLGQIFRSTSVSSSGYQSTPTATVNFPDFDTLYVDSVCSVVVCSSRNGQGHGFARAVPIGGGIWSQTAQSPYGQFATTTAPVLATTCADFVGCQTKFTGWTTASKEHINPSPSWVVAQGITLPGKLTINGRTLNMQVWMAQTQSGIAAHPNSTASLPSGVALTAVGARVSWRTSPTRLNPSGGAGNMIWRLKPRPDINGAEAASKDQWIPSEGSITTFAIGIKLVP